MKTYESDDGEHLPVLNFEFSNGDMDYWEF